MNPLFTPRILDAIAELQHDGGRQARRMAEAIDFASGFILDHVHDSTHNDTTILDALIGLRNCAESLHTIANLPADPDDEEDWEDE